MSSLAFFLMILHISAYFNSSLLSPFPTISCRFDIRAHIGDDILDFSCLLIALATLDALCWIMYMMISLMVSMSSSFCNVSNRFRNSCWNSGVFNPMRVVSDVH